LNSIEIDTVKPRKPLLLGIVKLRGEEIEIVSLNAGLKSTIKSTTPKDTTSTASRSIY
jgi:hypothetical protein